MNALQLYLVLYGTLALAHILVQILLGDLEFRRQKRLPFDPGWTPPVTVVVPIYNEEITVLHQCLRSIEAQRYPDVEAIVIDDGSIAREELVDVLDEFADSGFRVSLKPNSGKRHSQRAVLDGASGQVIVTVDSDTALAPDAVRMIVQRMRDPRVGAVTGDVRVANRKTNLLTRLISYRYWAAFHQERAAQSLFGVVMCCSGPFSAYRRDVLDEVKHAYAEQRFLGRTCTFGDDRHLTNLVLARGYRAVFDQRAVALTQVPTNLFAYLRQQTRWNKSFYREMLWTARFAHRRHPYLALDLFLQAVLPFLLLGALGAVVYQAVAIDPAVAYRYLLVLVGIALLRSSYGLLRTRDRGFVTFILYGFMHVLLLIPVRLYALATIRRTQWGTRAAGAPAS